MIATQANANLLKGVDLFSSLNDAQIGYIAGMTEEQRYKGRETILLESETSDAFFLIAEGSVKVLIT
jgi:CRP/FNR family transcriptional regulator/CRP/FNR family cyclic AMP-dependent transcriptional regulator